MQRRFVRKNFVRKGIDTIYVAAALVTALAFCAAVMISAVTETTQYASLQLSAAQKMADAELYLKEKMLALGIEAEPDDLNGMLLFGPEFTELTSTPGSVEAKRSSLNPNFAAAMVRYYKQAGLKEGNTVAIGTSGSFPGLAIAAVIAAFDCGLKAKIIASLGASMHGATRVEFNIFDILLALREGGFADFELTGISRGGANDRGGSVLEGMFFEGTALLSHEICLETSEKTGAAYINTDNLAQNIRIRLELYGNADMFVNIGGASVNSGVSTGSLNIPSGLALDLPFIPDNELRGLCFEYAARGIPVLNLLNVKKLCADNGIAFDPVPMSAPGDGGVYAETHYNFALAVLGALLSVCILVAGIAVPKFRKKI